MDLIVVPSPSELARIASTLVASKNFLDMDDPQWAKKAVKDAYSIYAESFNFIERLKQTHHVVSEKMF